MPRKGPDPDPVSAYADRAVGSRPLSARRCPLAAVRSPLSARRWARA